MDFLQGLNHEQQQAVTAAPGPVLIVAGPGTGKTKTLTARMAHLLSNDYAPTDIVALTFTNKAAREMRERLSRLLGRGVGLPKVTTFHALGRELLSQNGSSRTLISEAARTEIVRALPKPAGLKKVSVRELGLLISRAKTGLAPPDDPAVRELLAHYETALATENLHDFDDLLCRAYALLRHDPSRRPHFRAVLVDEFQDTSELQYESLKLLGAGENLFAIGDPNQSIYAFRGAGAEMFNRFRQDFPAARTIELAVNYRSCPDIVGLANAIFPDSPKLTAHQTCAGEARAVETLNEHSEAAYVLASVEHGIGGSDFLQAQADDAGRQPRDYAVLYRTHRVAKTVQRAFAEAGLPCQIAGEGSPYTRPDLQVLIAALRFAARSAAGQNVSEASSPAAEPPAAPSDDLAQYPNLTPAQHEVLLATAQVSAEKAVSDLAAELAEALQLDDEYIATFCGALVQFGAGHGGLVAALAYLDDMAESEFYDPAVNAVTLLTIHASKGLEFEHVFMIAAEDGILPKITPPAAANDDFAAEEKRLFYVAASRAKQTFEALYAQTRGGEPAALSRFITALPAAVLPRTVDPDMAMLQKRAARRARKRAQTSLF